MTFDLLSAVQPSSGWFAIVGIKDGSNVRQELVETREEADTVAQRFLKQERNVFFGVAKFKSDAGRTKDNVQALKAFWLDIDCGPTKAEVNPKTGRPNGYIDQVAGIAALKKFCLDTGLPRPILVSSGRGVHVYWPLEEDVTREQWEPAAAKLHQLCLAHNFYIDPQVFEVSRVLRIPGTLNFKDDPPQPVEVIRTAKPIAFDAFCSLLGVEIRVRPAVPKRELSELTKSLMANNVNNFAKIMRRSKAGDGCQQLWDCYENQATLDEPRWFDALSVAKFCEDQQLAIHRMSSGYEGYDPEATEQKIVHILGPHTCDVFERNNPGGCAGCPHLGKIKSPIVLGKDVAEASEENNVIVMEDPVTGDKVQYRIPKYPEPYFRGANGGIYRKGAGDEDEPILVLEDDFYVVKRMHDPEHKFVFLCRVHSPQEGVREFMLPNKVFSDKHALRGELAAEDVFCTDKRFNLLHDYIMTSLKGLRHAVKAENVRTQFGWADNDSKFIIGEREYCAEGTYHSPPSTVTKKYSKHLGPHGNFDKWREVFNLYGRSGLEPHAFAVLSAFGAPLLRYTKQSGAVINLIHPSSGTGKSTVLRMCASVYGVPNKLWAAADDTINARMLQLGVFNNLPFLMDEMTNVKAEGLSNMLYGMSMGKHRERMKGSSNELRDNNTTWQTISVCTSNSSFAERLGIYKNNPEGELMRMIEYKIESNGQIDPLVAKEMFDQQLMENYGFAGDIYAKWLVANAEEARNTTLSMQAKLDRELKITPRERFWSATMGANFAGGKIAKRLGLMDWKLADIYDWACTLILELRKDVTPPAQDHTAVVGDFINRNMQNILVVNDNVDRRTNMPTLPLMEPRGDLIVRYEPDTKLMFIAAKAFRDHCVTYQINYKETLKELEKAGTLLEPRVKRMSKGMKIVSPGVHALVFDCSTQDFLNMDNLVATEAGNGGGES